MSRSRTVLQEQRSTGAACGSLTDSAPCNTAACPVDCEVSDWSPFGACSASCGGGTMSRTRTVQVAPANGGVACPTLYEEASCGQTPW